MRSFLDRLYTGSGVLAALCLAGIFVVMLAQSFGREAGVFVRGADDIVAWLCAATAFLALGHTFRHGELVRVGLWLDMLGQRSRWLAELFALGVTSAFVAYMAFTTAGVAIARASGKRSRNNFRPKKWSRCPCVI